MTTNPYRGRDDHSRLLADAWDEGYAAALAATGPRPDPETMRELRTAFDDVRTLDADGEGFEGAVGRLLGVVATVLAAGASGERTTEPAPRCEAVQWPPDTSETQGVCGLGLGHVGGHRDDSVGRRWACCEATCNWGDVYRCRMSAGHPGEHRSTTVEDTPLRWENAEYVSQAWDRQHEDGRLVGVPVPDPTDETPGRTSAGG